MTRTVVSRKSEGTKSPADSSLIQATMDSNASSGPPSATPESSSPNTRRSSVASPPASQSSRTKHSGGSGNASSSTNGSRFDSERVIPSIEHDFDTPPPASSSASTTSHIRTPSVTVSPPPVGMRQGSTGQTAATSRRSGSDDTGRLVGRLGGMNLAEPSAPSSFDMAGIAAAIPGVAGDSTTDRALLGTQSPEPPASTPTRRSNRRRTSSRGDRTPHQVRDEELPLDRFHDPTVQSAFREAKSLMEDLTEVLASSALSAKPDSTIRRLHQRASQLAAFQCPSTRTVGFVGDSGVGKSSLLNSLLDYEGLARTSGSGAACTCVITEYRYHDRQDFVVDVELFSEADLADQVAELLQAYRHYHHYRDTMSDKEEQKDCEAKADVARDTFQAMFRGRLTSEDFLLDGPESAVLSTLLSWVRDMRPSGIGGKSSRATLNACEVLLMELTSEPNSPQDAAIWPYVRKISVFLNAHILSKGLILVDLPGLRDLNSARRAITERYLLKCNEVFAVCSILRATTDVGVSSVFDLARRARLDSVSIVCTRSEDVEAEEAKKDWKGSRARDIERFSDALASCQLHRSDLQAQIDEYEVDAGEELLDEEQKQLSELYRQSAQASKSEEMHRFGLKEYLVRARNSYVTEQLTRLYQDQVPGHRVQVFCVSNRDYWEVRQQPRDTALRTLELSGILALRKYCLSLVAESQLRNAVRYVADDIPALLADAELWVQSGASSATAEQKTMVRSVLDKLESELQEGLMGRRSPIPTLDASMQKEFRQNLYQTRRGRAWSMAAVSAALEWGGWHWASYAAFCRNFGDYYTNAVGDRNWNEEVIRSMVFDLEPAWEEFVSILRVQQEMVVSHIESQIESAIEHLERSDILPAAATLIQALTARQRLLLGEVEALSDQFEADLSALRTDTLSGIRTSYIGQALEDSYRSCNRESGTGSHARRKAIMNRRLQSDDLFESLMRRFRTSFDTLADSLRQNMDVSVVAHMGIFRETLDMIRSEAVALESDEDPEFHERVKEQTNLIKNGIHRIQEIVRL